MEAEGDHPLPDPNVVGPIPDGASVPVTPIENVADINKVRATAFRDGQDPQTKEQSASEGKSILEAEIRVLPEDIVITLMEETPPP